MEDSVEVWVPSSPVLMNHLPLFPPAPERQRVTVEVDEEAAREAPVSTRPVRTMVEIEEEPVKVSEPIVREAIIEESRIEEVPARGTDEVEIDRIAPNP